ncbi:uncharacterized protein LOC110100887 [Dendrobium catenatum]|uniref:uncharacterized protein LOC110100887 n=1 Tax=Dendrobium catenatum TaxID=906689 RepID=UPI0010A03968|nr:uncharacterized protein LOC110100887 [Dendrobium catenatum]
MASSSAYHSNFPPLPGALPPALACPVGLNFVSNLTKEDPVAEEFSLSFVPPATKVPFSTDELAKGVLDWGSSLIASEILSEFNGNPNKKYFCAKLDLRKAFNTVSRDFILNRLTLKGFPDIFVSWIKGCISDVHFSVNVNGALEGFFPSSSGLRQGCPLSPLLFSVVMDSFSCEIDDSNFEGIISGNISVKHLLYADDILVIGKASLANANSLKSLLSKLAEHTGLCINNAKCSILYSKNTPLATQITSLLGFFNAEDIRGAVIPKGVYKYIDKLCSKFLFYGSVDGKKLHLVAWKNTCLPKCFGGLGLPAFEALRFGFNCSFIWRFYTSPSLLAAWFKAKFISPWKTAPSMASKFWKSICLTAAKIQGNIQFHIASHDCKFSFFWDPWCNASAVATFRPPSTSPYLEVMECIHDGSWLIPSYLDQSIYGFILNIPISDNPPAPISWRGNFKPCFKAFVMHFYEDRHKVSWYTFVWHRNYALRFSSFVWLAMVDGLKTADVLAKRNIFIPSLCPFCRASEESISHLFFQCEFSFLVISFLLPSLQNFLLRPTIIQIFNV